MRMELLLLSDPVLHCAAKMYAAFPFLPSKLLLLDGGKTYNPPALFESGYENGFYRINNFLNTRENMGSVCTVALPKEIRLLKKIRGHLFMEHKRFTLALIQKWSFAYAFSITYRQLLKCSHLKDQMQLGPSVHNMWARTVWAYLPIPEIEELVFIVFGTEYP